MLITSREFKLSLFRCPSLKVQVPILVGITIILWLFFGLYGIQGLIHIVSIFFLPTFIAASFLPLLIWYEEEMNFRQSYLLSLVSLWITILFLLLYHSLGLGFRMSLLVAYGIPVSLRYIVYRGIYISDVFKSIPHTLLQSLIFLPFFHLLYPLSALDIVIFSLVVFFGLSSVTTFLAFLNRPFLKNFDVSATELLRMVYQLWVGNEKGKRDLEKVFKNLSIKSDVNYTVFSFKSEEKQKAIFVIPQLHPGPVKGIGGAMLPEILSNELEEDFGMVFSFHGPSTHVQNPINSEDCKILADHIKNGMEEVDYSNVGTSFVLAHEGAFIGAQILGNSLFFSVSFSPHPTEDIDAAIGEIISLHSKKKGFSRVGIVDAHNCITKGAIEVYYPSRRYRTIIEAIPKVFDIIKEKEMGGIRMGIASRKGYEKIDGIADEGIKVAVFEINDRKNAFVVIDGNNMHAGLREKIQEEIADLVDVSEVFTTDSHEVNSLIKDYNPVGYSMDHKGIQQDVRDLVEKAISDIEPVKVGEHSGTLANFDLMGPIASHRLTNIAETVYQVTPIAALMTFLIQFLLTTVLVLLI